MDSAAPIPTGDPPEDLAAPTRDRFYWDFHTKTITPWNKAAATVICLYVKELFPDRMATFTDKTIRKKVLKHFGYLKGVLHKRSLSELAQSELALRESRSSRKRDVSIFDFSREQRLTPVVDLLPPPRFAGLLQRP